MLFTKYKHNNACYDAMNDLVANGSCFVEFAKDNPSTLGTMTWIWTTVMMLN